MTVHVFHAEKQMGAFMQSVVTWSCYVGDGSLCHVRHEADNREDYKARKHAGTRVDAAHDDRVSGERKHKIVLLSKI